MPRLIWSAPAVRDVARLRAFLAPKNPDAARRAVAAIRQGVRLLGRHSEVGRPVEGLPIVFREWPIELGNHGYVLRYRYDGGEGVVLAVRHGRAAG